MFEPFAQAGQALARSKGGLGLGLALAKGVAELHGGHAPARNNKRVPGATFELRIPLRAQVDTGDRDDAAAVWQSRLAGFEVHLAKPVDYERLQQELRA